MKDLRVVGAGLSRDGLSGAAQGRGLKPLLQSLFRRYAVGREQVRLWLIFLVVGMSAHAAETVRLAHSRLQIGIDAATGQMTELVDRASGHNFISAATALWSIDYVEQGATWTLAPGDATQFAYQRGDGAAPELRLRWSGFAAAEVREVSVEVVARLATGENSSRWEIAVQKPAELPLNEVHFPRLSGLAPQPEEYLAVPVWSGELLANPRQALAGADGKGRRLTWGYPGRLSLQCLAFYRRDGAGLFLACDDAEVFRKSFAVQGDGRGGLGLEVSHLPENSARGLVRYAPAYGVVLGGFQGSWETAAERYRAWGTKQRWAAAGRLRVGTVPAWARETALWVWNRGRSEGVLPPAAMLQRELGLPVSVLWHWWHGCSYDAGFPEYLPPREGGDSFRRAMDDAHRSGLHAMVYMNQRLWGLSTRSWTEEGAEPFAVKAADGTYRKEVYNTFTNEACVSMCIGTGFWRNKYAGIAEQALQEYSVDGIYMDQACTSLACFDAAHGHPLGGGRFWMEAFRSLSADIRQRAPAGRVPALAGEGSGEAWLPYLDLMLSLQVSRDRYAAPSEGWEAIPFFQAVYHPYAIQFGNYSSLTMPPYDDLWPAATAPAEPLKLLDRKYSAQFRSEQARSFVWGQQLMLANFIPSQLQERGEEIAYVLRLARLRQRVLPYLLHGEFLPAPALDVPVMKAAMSRLSIYAGQKGGLTTFEKSLPQAYAGAWRSPAGNVAVALASIAPQEQTLTLSFDPARYGIAAGTQVFRIDESGRSPLAAPPQEGKLRVTLPPEGACVIEFAPR